VNAHLWPTILSEDLSYLLRILIQKLAAKRCDALQGKKIESACRSPCVQYNCRLSSHDVGNPRRKAPQANQKYRQACTHAMKFKDLRGVVVGCLEGKCAWKTQITCCFSSKGLFSILILIFILEIEKSRRSSCCVALFQARRRAFEFWRVGVKNRDDIQTSCARHPMIP